LGKPSAVEPRPGPGTHIDGHADVGAEPPAPHASSAAQARNAPLRRILRRVHRSVRRECAVHVRRRVAVGEDRREHVVVEPDPGASPAFAGGTRAAGKVEVDESALANRTDGGAERVAGRHPSILRQCVADKAIDIVPPRTSWAWRTRWPTEKPARVAEATYTASADGWGESMTSVIPDGNATVARSKSGVPTA